MGTVVDSFCKNWGNCLRELRIKVLDLPMKLAFRPLHPANIHAYSE